MKGFELMLESIRISALSLVVAPLFSVQSCSKKEISYVSGGEETFIAVITSPCGNTKSSAPDEDRIWDINFYVTDAYGSITAHRFNTYANGVSGDISIDFKGLRDVEYHIFVLANIGYDLGVHNESWIKEWKLYLRYPEGNIRGIAMSGSLDFISRADKGDSYPATVQLTRMMAKITLVYDGSDLSPGVSMTPGDARICNCPRCAYAFRESHLESADDIFPVGYTGKWTKNRVDLYMLENTGWTSPDTDCSSYVEISFDYESPSHVSTGRGLIYRFYLHDTDDAYGVSRNGHYTITIHPTGNGINSSDTFRIDSSNLRKID